MFSLSGRPLDGSQVVNDEPSQPVGTCSTHFCHELSFVAMRQFWSFLTRTLPGQIEFDSGISVQ